MIFFKKLLITAAVSAVFFIYSCGQPLAFTDLLGESFYSESVITAGLADYAFDSLSDSPSVYSVNQSFTQSFVLKNIGINDGSSSVMWRVYISKDLNLDEDDELCASGIELVLRSGESISITFSGTWPETAGVYYLIAEVTSYDDSTNSNNKIFSSGFTITSDRAEVDYEVTDLSAKYPYIVTSSLCSESFNITNIGGEDGNYDISWSAFASEDASLDEETDFKIGESVDGSLEGLHSGASYSGISLNGNWPADAGIYYLIVKIEADDDFLSNNNKIVIGPFNVVSNPDYVVQDPLVTLADVYSEQSEQPGTALSEGGTFEFTIAEQSGHDGGQQIGWDVYVSLDPGLSSEDYKLNSGSLGPLKVLAPTALVTFNDNDARWPSMGSYYYIIINIKSGDDINLTNNTWVSELYLPSVYNEDKDEKNDIFWPSGTEIDMDSVSILDGSLTNSVISVGELIHINGIGDTSDFDTYKFSVEERVSEVIIKFECETVTDGDIDMLLRNSVDPDVLASSWSDEYELVYTEYSKNVIYYIAVQFVKDMDGVPYTVTLYGQE